MKYSKEFKEEALKLSDEIGLKKAAQQLGIQYYTRSDWRSKRNAAAKVKNYHTSDDEATLSSRRLIHAFLRFWVFSDCTFLDNSSF